MELWVVFGDSPQIKHGIVMVMKKQKLYLNKSEVAPVKTSR